MARAHLMRPITDREGNLLYNATVTVREVAYAIPIAQPIYSGPTGDDELSNPYTTASGVIDFWLDTPQRVALLVQADGQSDTVVYLDAPPPPEQIVATDSPLEIVNTPSVSGQVLLSTSLAGQAQWGNPPSGTGLTPVVVVASESFSTGSDPGDWSFTATNGGTHGYDAAIPPGTNYTHSLTLTQTANSGTSVVTGPTFTLLESGRVSMWIKTDIASTETLVVEIVDSSSVHTVQATINQDQDWGFFAFDVAAGTWHSMITYTGQAVFDGTATHQVHLTGYVAQYGGTVPPHTHDGTGTDSTALGEGAVASATGSTAVGAAATASGINASALGYNASAAGTSTLAAGYNASAPTDYSLAVGAGATGSATATAWAAVGQNANAGGQEALAVGKGATVSSDYGVAVGSAATVGVSAASAVAIGQNASAQAQNAVAIGQDTVVGSGHDNSVALGSGATTTSSNQIMLGNQGALATVLGSMQNYGIVSLGTPGSRIGFYGSAGNVQQVVQGSDDGNVTLRTLVQALGNMGLIINNSVQQPVPFKSPVGVIDYFYHQDPGDGSLGVSDFDFQPYAYAPLAFSSKNPYPSGPQWYVGSDHNGYKGFASGLGAMKNVYTTKQSALFIASTVGTGNKICLTVRHTGEEGSTAACGYFILDQDADTLGFFVKEAGSDSDTFTQIGSLVTLSTSGLGNIFDGNQHSLVIQASGPNVMFLCPDLLSNPFSWTSNLLNATGTYVGIDFNQDTTQLNAVIFVPQETWDSFETVGNLVNALSGEAWWPIVSGSGASASVSSIHNLHLVGATSGYALAYVLTQATTGIKTIQTRWATGTVPTTAMGVVGRYTDSNNYIFINNSQITRILSGTQTTLATLSQTFVAGDVMRADFNAKTGSIQVYRNGALIGSVTDTNFLTSPRYGLGTRGAATANFSYLWVFDAYNLGVIYK